MQETTQTDNNKKNIKETQIDVLTLFERLVQIETKLDLHKSDAKKSTRSMHILFIIVIIIELFNALLNFLMLRGT